MFLCSFHFSLLFVLRDETPTKKNSTLLKWSLVALISSIYSAKTLHRNTEWRDAITLFKAAVRVSHS